MEVSIVRQNLMTREFYTPYCGAMTCLFRSPRTKWDNEKKQFVCSCGWNSSFPKDFIDRYIKKWNL